MLKLNDVFLVSKRSKEREDETRRKKEKAKLLSDSWKAMKALLNEIEEHGEEWVEEKTVLEVKEGPKRNEVKKRKREDRVEDEDEDVFDEEDTKKRKKTNHFQSYNSILPFNKVVCGGGVEVYKQTVVDRGPPPAKISMLEQYRPVRAAATTDERIKELKLKCEVNDK